MRGAKSNYTPNKTYVKSKLMLLLNWYPVYSHCKQGITGTRGVQMA